VNLATILLGPLAGPECRRALARGWLIVVRTLVGLLPAAIVVLLLWIWWLALGSDPFFNPAWMLRYALSTSAMIVLTIAVVQAPAVLAGSLAGERERGVLQLLLTTAVNAREVVLGRLLGKLSQVGMIVLSSVPLLALLAAWNGFNLLQLGTLLLLPAAVALGGGGLAVGASVVSRRGRDALLSVYIIILGLFLSPLLAGLGLPAPAEVAMWLATFNPYVSMNRLAQGEEVIPALATSGLWLLMGLAGVAVASWRLRPTCLASTEKVKKAGYRGRVPELGERPMLWKELYIERVGTLGRFGRWLGVLVTLGVGGGSLVLAGVIVWGLFRHDEAGWTLWATDMLSVLGGGAGMFLGWLLQLAIGLRAAVSIASERERATWDALLMSPLEPGEIARAKLVGSLHALRFMVGAVVLAFTIAVIVGAIPVQSYVTWMAGNAVSAALMAAIGVRCSLALPTATRAMTWTIASWLISFAVVAFVAGSIIAIGVMFFLAVWTVAVQYALVSLNSPPWFPMSMSTAWPLTTDLVTLLIALLIEFDTRLRFDRIAGRMAGGAMATKVDEWLYGHPLEPVFIPARKRARKKEPVPALVESLEN
jgi:ABC-type transport system involved in multi-copper enzyme maturation permease subunit